MLGIPVLCPDETIRHQQILTLKADSIWHPKKYKMVQDPEKQSLGNNMKSQDNPPFQILTQETGGFGMAGGSVIVDSQDAEDWCSIYSWIFYMSSFYI